MPVFNITGYYDVQVEADNLDKAIDAAIEIFKCDTHPGMSWEGERDLADLAKEILSQPPVGMVTIDLRKPAE